MKNAMQLKAIMKKLAKENQISAQLVLQNYMGFGIVQIGLALKGHDASQRAQGFMTFFGGVVIYFAKDILDMIL